MSFDTRLPQKFFLPVGDGLSLSLPFGAFKEKSAEVIKHLLDEANQLPTDQHALFIAHVHMLAGEIKAYIQELRRKGYSENEIEKESETQYSRLQIMGDEFLNKTIENNHKQLHASCRAKDFGERLQKIKLNFPDFVAPPTPKAPSLMGFIRTARKPNQTANKEVHLTYAHSKANVEQNMGIARAVGWVVDQIGEGMQKDCKATPQSQWLCHQGQKLAKGIMDATGLSKLAVEPKALPETLHDLYGIDKKAGAEYAKDGLKAAIVVASSAIPAGAISVFSRFRPVTTAALKPIRQQTGIQWTMRLLKEDSGSVVIPFHQGLETSALEASEQCFRQLSYGVNRIAQIHFENAPNTHLSTVWSQYHHLLKELIPDLSHRVVHLADATFAPLQIMIKEATGMEPVFLHLEKMSPTKNVFKIANSSQSFFIAEMGAEESIANFYGMHHARLQNLKHGNIPVPVAIARHGNSNYLGMTNVGNTYKHLFQNRKVPGELSEPVYELGRAAGEFAAKKAILVHPDSPLHEFFLGVSMRRVLVANQAKSVSQQQVLRIHDRVGETLQQTPVYAGLSHGDAHLGNFTWKWETGQVGIIDFARYTNHLTIEMQATGFPVYDYVGIIRSIVLNGKLLNMPPAEITAYVNAFKKGYHEMHPSEPIHVSETINLIYEQY